MLQVDMSASMRESFGKGAMRRLRVSGKTPAVLYGNDKDVLALQLDTKTFLKNLFKISRKNAVVNLSINGGDTRHVMMKEIQTDPVNDSLIHADFFEINLQAPKRFTVAIEYEGKAKGEDLGGEMVVHNSLIVVEGLPLDIPDVLSVDVSGLNVNESIHYSDIKLSESVTIVTAGSDLCVEVISARAAAAAHAAADAAANAAEAADEAAVAEAAAGESAAIPEVEDASEGAEAAIPEE
ncbi:MAG: 50S ribosomal protein L25 [Desulfocapsa sp.]|nr:50S ribosomal protein L25 [Desulfocapsa sp.]